LAARSSIAASARRSSSATETGIEGASPAQPAGVDLAVVVGEVRHATEGYPATETKAPS